jgi:hypothetical protein
LSGIDVLVILIAPPDLRKRTKLTSDLNQLWDQVSGLAGNDENRESKTKPLDAAAN